MENSLFQTGVRPHIDAYLLEKSKEVRDYGDKWSASSAGYCMRKVIFDRMKVTPTSQDARKTRVFEVGHIFHGWVQDITKNAGVSIAQETELIDDELHIKGHIDDLVLVSDKLILYDYKTANSRSFTYKKGKPMSHYHQMQLGTYMYLLRKLGTENLIKLARGSRHAGKMTAVRMMTLDEARICTISKDDLRMSEDQLLWNGGLENAVVEYWTKLNAYWEQKKLPPCTCHEYEGGFMSKKEYNPYYFQGEPCSLQWYRLFKAGEHLSYIKED